MLKMDTIETVKHLAIKIAIKEGYIYVEYRTAAGYDRQRWEFVSKHAAQYTWRQKNELPLV